MSHMLRESQVTSQLQTSIRLEGSQSQLADCAI